MCHPYTVSKLVLEYMYLLVNVCTITYSYVTCFVGPQADDPFFEDPTTPVMIGTVNLYMQSLCYKIELQEQLVVTDYKGQEMGQSVCVT